MIINPTPGKLDWTSRSHFSGCIVLIGTARRPPADPKPLDAGNTFRS
jgi:hypothetical protein